MTDEENNMSAVMEPNELTGTVVDVRIDLFEGDYGPKVSLNVTFENPNFENPFFRNWKVTRDDSNQVKRGCELARMVLQPLQKFGVNINEFTQLKGLTLKMEEFLQQWNIDGEHVEKMTWKVIELVEDDDEEESEETSEPEPKPKAKSKAKAKAEEEEEENEEDDEDDEDSEENISSVILAFLKEKPKRRFKTDVVVNHVLNSGLEVDDNDVEAELKALKKAKQVREPKFGNWQAV